MLHNQHEPADQTDVNEGAGEDSYERTGEQNLLSSSDESGTDTADQMNGPSDPALFIGMRSRDHKKLARKPSLLSAIAAALAVPQRET